MGIFVVLALCAVSAAAAVFWFGARVKRQVSEICAVLEEIKAGNGNRRILMPEHAVTAPLAYAVNEMTADYESRLSALRQTEQANKQLMTSLSHDVRTPLITLIGYLDAVHKGVVTGKEREADIEVARRKAYDLKEYIDVLFDWFKLNSNELAMELSSVETGELTRECLIDWVPILEDRRIAYRFEIPERPFWVKLDADGYLRILNNLMQNVVAHSGADEVSITLSKHSGQLRVCLSDNGVGIEKEDLKHIFERLYKCDKGRSEKGSGLGLSIVRQLTERMHGTITAESVPGEGTAFTLCFPLEK